jgi:Mrp family chromosome partitioning ATPase
MARIQREARDHPLHQLMIVGAARGVGASFVAGQTAAQLADAGLAPVLVVEVAGSQEGEQDLSGPAQSRDRDPGRDVSRIRLSADTCLRLFSAGKGGGEGLPEAWRQAFELVLWDVPPPTVTPVSLAMARRMDGTMLVVHANRTRRQVAQHVAGRLEDSGGRLLGVVLNRTVNYIPEWIYRWL